MQTFGLSDALTILIGTCVAAVVFAAAPYLWGRVCTIVAAGRRPSVKTYQIARHTRARFVPIAEPVRQVPEPVEPAMVLSDTNQSEPIEPSVREPAREPAQLYRLSRRDEIIMLAIQRNEDGSYRHSANAITAFIGGTAADVKDIIREVREGATKPAPPPPATVQRPANGW